MIRRVFIALIFGVAVCGAVFAADEAPAGREEVSLETAGKERMVPMSAQPDGGAPRATIDIGDEALPKPIPAEKTEEAATPAVSVEKGVEKEVEENVEEGSTPQADTPSQTTTPEPQLQSQPQSRGPDLETPVEVKAITVAEPRPPVETVRPVLQNKKFPEIVFSMPWQTELKKELTKEEELDNKVQGRLFRGETGFTTVTTYKNKGIKSSDTESKQAMAESGLVTLDLNDCIKIAEANHIQAIVTRKSIKLAEMRLFEARRNMLPSATIVVERSKGRVSDYGYLGRKQYIEGQQPIYHGGELYFTMKQAEVNLQIAKNDHNRVKNELVLQIKKAYYTLEKAKENASLQNALSKEVEKRCNISLKGYEAGVVARVEYLNVNSQSSQTKYQLASAEGDVSIAELILKQAMNVNLRDNFGIAPSPELKKVTLDFEKTLQDAFMNRPEIKANALMVTYYNYGKGIANAKSLPKVDLLGQWGVAWEDYTASDVSTATGGVSDSPRRNLQPQWYAGIKASVPFAGSTAEYSYTREDWTPVVQTLKGTEATTNSFKFKILDKLDMFSDKQLADIDFDRSRSELNKTKNDVVLEVREGCFNYEKALIQLETAANKVKYQETDAELMRMKRGMDEVQDSNVIDSLIKVAQENFGYVQAVTDCKVSLAALEKAVGVEDYFKNR